MSDSALRLNRIVVASLLQFGIPAITISPLSSGTTTQNGSIVSTSKDMTKLLVSNNAETEHLLLAGRI